MKTDPETEAAVRAVSEMLQRRGAKAFVYMPGLAEIAVAMRSMSMEDMKAFREEAILLMDAGLNLVKEK